MTAAAMTGDGPHPLNPARKPLVADVPAEGLEPPTFCMAIDDPAVGFR